MCKKNIDWISILADLGYELQIIEQTINTSSGDAVKPDVIVASNQLLHSIVFEAKGGITIDADQLNRYSTLKPNDLRWVSVFDREHLQMNVCICDIGENHILIKMVNTQFPTLTFTSDALTKEGTFNREKLNTIFKEPISLKGKLFPLSYYPFSDTDEESYIAAHVIRTILSIYTKSIKLGSMGLPEERLIAFDDVIATRFNPVWKALSIEHRKALKSKIADITKRVLANEKIRESLGVIQQRKGYKITRTLEQFKTAAEQFIEELESQTTLDSSLFMNK